MWFRQEPVLKDFCDKVQKWRAEAKTQFEKDYYKLILNSLYGRMLMNMRKFSDSELITDPLRFEKVKESNIIRYIGKVSDNMMFASLEKKEHKLNNPIAIGSAILGISKWAVWSFWYRMKDTIWR